MGNFWMKKKRHTISCNHLCTLPTHAYVFKIMQFFKLAGRSKEVETQLKSPTLIDKFLIRFYWLQANQMLLQKLCKCSDRVNNQCAAIMAIIHGWFVTINKYRSTHNAHVEESTCDIENAQRINYNQLNCPPASNVWLCKNERKAIKARAPFFRFGPCIIFNKDFRPLLRFTSTYRLLFSMPIKSYNKILCTLLIKDWHGKLNKAWDMSFESLCTSHDNSLHLFG